MVLDEDSTAVSIFVVILVELTVFVNSTNIATNIETTVQSRVALSRHLIVGRYVGRVFFYWSCPKVWNWSHPLKCIEKRPSLGSRKRILCELPEPLGIFSIFLLSELACDRLSRFQCAGQDKSFSFLG